MGITLSVRTLSIRCALAGVLAVAVVGAAHAAQDAASAARYVSVSIEADGSRSVALYRVPTGMRLLVTQACQEHPAMYVELGDRGQRISYNGHGCTKFSPGFAVEGGTTLNCVNKSGQSRSCVLLGMLEKSAPVARPGARFYDVE
jgi:hypothetical protein